MASQHQSPPSPTSTTQQSLNIYSGSIIIEKLCNGGSRSIVEELPEPKDEKNITVREMQSEVGKPDVEYPRERDGCIVSKHSKRRTYRNSSSSTRYEYKTFDIELDREKHADEAERLSNVVERVQKLPELSEAVNAIETYDELVEESSLVREYEATYRIVKSIWKNDSLRPYAMKYTARHLEIDQFPQGFFVIPGPHHTNVREILDKKLQNDGIASYSVSWGGFIVEPDDFTNAYEIVEPAYHTPDNDQRLTRQTLDG